ncbi:hypothetical protein LINGRAHAP2_LOCUS19657 [Linum grandiflorum]
MYSSRSNRSYKLCIILMRNYVLYNNE